MLNLTLVGNLGADATVGATRNGTPLATLRVAVNHMRTDATTGERIESAEWFRVRAMGRLVDLGQRLTKGSRVLVIGRLTIGHYQSSEGDPRISYDVWADELVLLSPRSDAGANERHDSDEHRPGQPPIPPHGPGSRRGSDRLQPTDDGDESRPW
jgi:single-strand DNA-binding protein